MMAPIRLANRKKAEEFAKRLEGLRSATPPVEGDVLTRSAIGEHYFRPRRAAMTASTF